jgi:hypothetical protein
MAVSTGILIDPPLITVNSNFVGRLQPELGATNFSLAATPVRKVQSRYEEIVHTSMLGFRYCGTRRRVAYSADPANQ